MEWKTKALLLAAAAGGVYWQNVWVDHSRRVISDSRLPKSFDGFTILHLSDLHFGPSSFARRQTLSRKYGRPDLIAVTGDLLDRDDPESLRAAADWVKQAVKMAPVYLVPGNHEARAKEHYPAVRDTLKQAGATVLEDRGVLYKRGGEAVALLGIRDPRFFETKEGFSHALHRRFPSSCPTARNGWLSMPKRVFLWCFPAMPMGDRCVCRESAGCMPRTRGFSPATPPGCTAWVLPAWW